MEVLRRGGMNNLSGQKQFLTNLEVQNNGKVCPLAGEEKFYCLYIHLDLHKLGREDEWRETVMNFGIKIRTG